MPFPFRTPATEEWTPPDYAKPVSASSEGEEWSPPSYATPVKKEETKKPSAFSRTIEALKPAKTIKPTGSLLPSFLKPSTEPIPYESDEEKAAKKKPEEKGLFSRAVESASRFLSEHPKIREAGQRFLTGTSPEFEEEIKKRGVSEIQGPGVMSIPGVKQATDYLSQKVAGSEGNTRLAAGAVIQALGGILEGGFDPRTAGIKGPKVAPKPIEAAEINNKLEDFMKKNPRATMSNLEEFIKTIREPIRRSREIPYRMEEPVDIPKPAAKPDMEKFSQSVAEQTAPKVAEAPTEEVTSSQGKVDRIGGLEIRSGGMELSSDAELEQFLDSSNAETRAMAAAEVKRRYTKPQTAAIEEKKPFVSPFEKKTEKPLEQTFGEFGGVGHPDEPGYANKVLKRAGSGEPGLAVEPVEGLDNVNHVVYRNKEGEPIAAAMVVKDQSGKTMVQDLAADKSKGLLTGRAMKALGGKLEELGATEAAGTVSPDAQNFIAKMKERASARGEIKPPTEVPMDEIRAQLPPNQDIGELLAEEESQIRKGRSIERPLPSEFEAIQGGKFGKLKSAESTEMSTKDLVKLRGPVVGMRADDISRIEKLKSSIKKEGIKDPIVLIRKDNGKLKIDDGHHRLIAADELGIENVPIKIIPEWQPPEYAKPVEAISAEQKQQLKDLGYTESQIGRISPQEATNLVNARMQASKGGYGAVEEELSKRGLSRSRGSIDSQFKLYTPEELRASRTQASSHNIPADWGTGPLTEEEKALLAGEEAPTTINASGESAASQEAINRQASMKAKSEQYVVYDRAGNARPLIGPEAVDYQPRPGETFGIITPTRGFRVLESRGGKIPGRAGLAEFISEEGGGMRWEGPVPGGGEVFEGPQGRVLNKLFNALEDAKENVGAQEVLNRQERARRFAAFGSVKEEGAAGAARSLSKLKGEFAKVQSEALGLKPQEADSLFTAIKQANITAGEKARGYTALFKLMNGEGTPVRSELKILDDVFGNGFADKVTELHGGLGLVGLKVSKLASTMKSMQNALSLAAPLRHGIGLVYKKEFYPAFKDMFKFFANKEFYNTSMKALEERPNYLLGRDSGLFLAKPGSLQSAEEEFLNSYVGALPGIRNVVGASQRAYTGFLNKLRADVFDSMTKQAEGLGAKMSVGAGDSIEATREARAIAKFINNATGRGDLGSLNKITNELNVMFWSPRMIASRVNMLANPKIYMDLPKGMRLEGLKSLLGIAALGTTIDTLAAYGGAKISSNILSTDFGKSRFGTKLIDPWGGFQQYVVFAARFLAGKTDSQHPQTRLDIGERFIANKLSPVASLARNILTAKPGSQGKEGPGTFTTQYGQPTSIQREVAKTFTPIFIQDLQTLAQSEPDWSENVGLTAAMAGASLTGMAQEYPERQKGKLGFRKMKIKP